MPKRLSYIRIHACTFVKIKTIKMHICSGHADCVLYTHTHTSLSLIPPHPHPLPPHPLARALALPLNTHTACV